ncbi:MAG: hypothetical protein ACYSUX_05400 [Planctomycetota bacterium]|jgi:hypothetical protein
MTSQDDFLKKLIKFLGDCSIPYMISGSFSSSYHGQPRATKDLDIVIAPTEKQLLELIESLSEDYYVSLEAVRDALANNSMFNVIDSLSGWKADFILRKDRAFSRQEFERKGIAEIGGLDVWVTSPEDIILSKLEWSKDSQSERQFGDALGVAAIQWDRLDVDYLRKWAKELQVRDSLEQLLEQAGRLVKKSDTFPGQG